MKLIIFFLHNAQKFFKIQTITQDIKLFYSYFRGFIKI